MRRVVYSPKAFVFVRTQGSNSGIDISPFVTSGSVNRVVNEVSTAEVTIRNVPLPGERHGRWTLDPTDAHSRATFHPMDPITIFLARQPDKPIQVFTGYLDTTPYIQLFPGTITLKASCTLKRLLHTYWDPALPFTQAFLKKFNWTSNLETGQIINFGALKQQLDKQETPINDAGFGSLMFEILKTIGHWRDDEIHIENLPDGIVETVKGMFRQIQADNEQAQTDFTDLLHKMIGTGQQGTAAPSGNNATGDIKGADKVVPVLVKISNQFGIPPEMTVATAIVETDLTGSDSGGYLGWFQMQTGSAPYAYGTFSRRPPSAREAHDLGIAATGFCSAAAGWVKAQPSLRHNLQLWAEKTQGVTANLSGNPRFSDSSQWNGFITQARNLISKYGSSNTSSSTRDSGTDPNAPHGNTGDATHDSGTAPDAPHGTTTQGKSSGTHGTYAYPVRGHVSSTSIDNGVDFEGAYPGDLIAIDSGVITTWHMGFTGDGALVMKMDHPWKGYQWVYYGHIDDVNKVAKPGTRVTAGQVIAHTSAHPPGAESSPGHVEIGFAINGDQLALGHAAGDRRGSNAPQAGKDFNTFVETIKHDPNAVSPGGAGGASASGGGQPFNTFAAAFVAQIEGPTALETSEAMLLQGQKSLMNDKPLMPFIQQVCGASLRHFQSLPNGSFFAFFPDYFGTYHHRSPYWTIYDIEILDGKIELSDDALKTHIYAVGDHIPFAEGDMTQIINDLASGGVVTIFNAFNGKDWLVDGGKSPLLDTSPGHPSKMALQFLAKFGARPLYQQEPFIRSSYFEAFMAFQLFQLAWSRQFLTEFSLTFMPELFPGGRVTFKDTFGDDYGFACYIDQVTHSWDYESGFTTQVNLSSPSAYPPNNNNPMARGMINSL